MRIDDLELDVRAGRGGKAAQLPRQGEAAARAAGAQPERHASDPETDGHSP
jgi:hypothetical protein